MAVTKKTYHEGAEAERKAFIAYLRRQNRKAQTHSEGWLEAIGCAVTWVQGRCDRYKKRKGGL